MLKGNLIRIAVIDDDEDDYFIIKDYIKEIEGGKFEVEWFNDYKKAIEQIAAAAYHIYFVDYRLGSRTGLDFLEDARMMGCDDPIVLLTGKGNRAIDIKAMQSGATDYLVKSDLNTEKLERCIRYSLDRAASLKELKERENKYRNLFEGSKDSVFIADKNLFFIEYNQAAVHLFGFNDGELSKHSLSEFIKDDHQKKKIAELLEKEENINDMPVQIETQNENIKLCLLSISLQKKSTADYLIHGIIHDITNIKKAEMANIQAQKLAANERLVRILAHEIRNPLNNITLAIDQLQLPDEEDEEREKNLLAIIQRNCTRINKIITELLDLTKPLELKFKRYTLQEILDESLLLATDRINLQNIKVLKNYPASPMEILADKSKLIIAFTNLVINAIEAMEINKGELTVSMAATPEAYSVSIKDNGKGIPEEYLSKLFEPFFTLKKNGMGLGLAACYSIIESHKGSIHVESKENKGSNFIVNFNKG